MDHPSKSISNLTILTLFILGIISISIWGLSISNHTLKCQNLKPISRAHIDAVEDELAIALSAAATADRTVIIALANRAYAEQVGGQKLSMLDLFLDGFWAGEGTRDLVDHLLIVAVDQIAYERCRFRRLNCFRLEGVDFEAEEIYMSGHFVEMMWRRTVFLLDVLRRGYSFIFTDTDVLWLRNPFTRLSPDQTLDLQISTDNFSMDSSPDAFFLINTGFYFVRSNPKTIALFDLWHTSKTRFPSMKEQDVLLTLMHEGVFENLTMNVKFLDTRYFSGFCKDSRDARDVVTVHANCCRSISAKVTDLTAVLRAWRGLDNGGNGNATARWFGYGDHVACFNSWLGVDNGNATSFETLG